MAEDKRGFVQMVKDVLTTDHRSGVEDITYDKEGGMEFIYIVFNGGGRVKINVTCNSNGANFMEIGRAVYGEGAIGQWNE